MHKIWTAEYYCPQCKRNLKGDVYSDNIQELPDGEKEKIKEHFLSDHNLENHIYCWKCKKHIELEKLENLIAVGTEAKPLCGECAKSASDYK